MRRAIVDDALFRQMAGWQELEEERDRLRERVARLEEALKELMSAIIRAQDWGEGTRVGAALGAAVLVLTEGKQ